MLRKPSTLFRALWRQGRASGGGRLISRCCGRPGISRGQLVHGRGSGVAGGVGVGAVVALQAGAQGFEGYWRSALVLQVPYAGAEVPQRRCR
jgi:hypothetical protein